MDAAAKPSPAPASFGAAPSSSSSPPPYDFLAERKQCESVAELTAIFTRYSDYMQRWSPMLAREWGHDEMMRKHAIFLRWYDAQAERLCPPKPLWRVVLQCMGVLAVGAGDGSSQPLMDTPAAHSTSSSYRSSACMEGSHLTHRRPIALDSMG